MTARLPIPSADLLRTAEFEVSAPPGLDLWRRNGDGCLYRGPVKTWYRARVWDWLHRYGLSWPEVAELTGCTNHSTATTAVTKYRAGKLPRPEEVITEDHARTLVAG